MYPTVEQAQASFEAIQRGLQERANRGAVLPRVILCPPFLSLVPFAALVDHRVLSLGAQNCHWKAEGPYTGEISPRMLQGLVDYVLVGHNERREAGETDEQIGWKVGAVAEHGLTPILLVGEDDPGEDAILASEQQLRRGLAEVDVSRPVRPGRLRAHVGHRYRRDRLDLAHTAARSPTSRECWPSWVRASPKSCTAAA